MIKNDPSRAGQRAARQELFGEYRRYAVYPVYTRFDAVQWFVADAMTPDPDNAGLPSIIRQEDTKEAAMHGLN